MKNRLSHTTMKPVYVHVVHDSQGEMQLEPTVHMLIAALRAQQALIHDLESRISSLEGQRHAH
jgi:hypothetical protein